MPDKKKLQQLLSKLGNLENSLPKGETLSMVESIVNSKYKDVASKVKEDSSLQFLDEINKKLVKFQKDFDLEPIATEIDSLSKGLNEVRAQIAKEIQTQLDTSKANRVELQGLVQNNANEFRKMSETDKTQLLKQLSDLNGKISSQDFSASKEVEKLQKVSSDFNKRIADEFSVLKKEVLSLIDQPGTDEKINKNSQSVKNVLTEIEDVRKEFLTRLNNMGGGSPNQRIMVNSSVMSSKYADINLIGGITKSDNNTTKQVDITFSGGGGGTGNQFKVFLTVGYDTNNDYVVLGGSVSADTYINSAIVAANAAGGGVVYVQVGTYTISNPVTMLANVILAGSKMISTTIKAKTNYYASASTHSIVRQLSATNNFNIYDITWDRNGQNESNLTIDGSAAMEFVNCTFVRVERCEIKNPVYYTVFIALSSYIWINGNYVASGWTTKATTTQQDGIHLSNCTYGWVADNYIDTYGIGSPSITSSGDDAIAIQADKSTNINPALHILVARNIIRSGSRGIGLFVDAAQVSHINVVGNIIQIAAYSGIKLQRAGATLTGTFNDINISGNIVEAAGDYTSSPTEGSAGIEFDAGGNTSQMFTAVLLSQNIIEKTTSTSGTPAGAGIFIPALGTGLSLIGNSVKGIAGAIGVKIGSISALPVTDYTANGNLIDVSTGATNVIGMLLAGTTRGEAIGNSIKGHVTGTTYGILIQANTTATSAYNDISHNNISTFDNGIVEQNQGANPDNNQYIGNTFNAVTTNTVLLGTSSRQINGSGAFFGIGTSSPLSILEVMGDYGGANDYGTFTVSDVTTPAKGVTAYYDKTNDRGVIYSRQAGIVGKSLLVGNPNSLYGILINGSTGSVGIQPTAARTSGSPNLFTITGPADTTLDASVEASDINWNLARTVQFATGALTTQRAVRIQAPTYGFVGASTITNAATLAISGAPVKGTNATITNSHGLLIEAGATSTAAASFGLTVNTPTGGTTNFAAQFLGGNVGIKTSAPNTSLEVLGDISSAQDNGTINVSDVTTPAKGLTLYYDKTNDWSVIYSRQAGVIGKPILIGNPFNNNYMFMTAAGNLKLGGTAARGTTEGTNELVIFNGTAPAGTLTNGVALYSASGKLNSMDAAGNNTVFPVLGGTLTAIKGTGRSTAQTAAVASVAAYTVGASDASFLVSANVLVTTATVHSFTATVTYTDEGNTSRTVTMQFSTLAGAFVTAMTNAQGTVPYEGVPLHIRAKASTAITIATTGTFTTVTYNVEGIIQQVS